MENIDKSVEIVINSTGITVSEDKSIVKTEQPKCLTNAIDLQDPPDLFQTHKLIRQLTSKAALFAWEKFNVILELYQPKPDELIKFMELALKLLDAQSAYEWSEAFRQAILKQPKYSTIASNGRGQGFRHQVARSQASNLVKVNRGDDRTTPNKLINNMPKDDDDSSAPHTLAS